MSRTSPTVAAVTSSRSPRTLKRASWAAAPGRDGLTDATSNPACAHAGAAAASSRIGRSLDDCMPTGEYDVREPRIVVDKIGEVLRIGGASQGPSIGSFIGPLRHPSPAAATDGNT